MQGTQEKAFKIALAHKLPIAFATDAGVFPHGENAREFKLRVGLGQSPMAAIEGATRIAAEAMGWSDRVGTLQPGLFADLIAVDKDPLADITELERVQLRDEGRHGAQSRDPGLGCRVPGRTMTRRREPLRALFVTAGALALAAIVALANRGTPPVDDAFAAFWAAPTTAEAAPCGSRHREVRRRLRRRVRAAARRAPLQG